MKLLPLLTFSALLLFSGCMNLQIPLGTTEDQYLGRVLSTRVVSHEGNLKIYESVGNYYYFRDGVLVQIDKGEASKNSTVPEAPVARQSPPPKETAPKTTHHFLPRFGKHADAVAKETPPKSVSQVNSVSKVQKPEDMPAAFASAFNSRDIEQLVALYEVGAAVAPPARQQVAENRNLRAALSQLLTRRGTMQAKAISITQVGNIAMLQGEMRLTFTDESGSSVDRVSKTTDILRQQPDGSWLYVIGQPFLPE